MLFTNSKVEIKMQSYKDYRMAELIARRLHKFANWKEGEYRKLGLKFIISESAGKTTIYIASNKLRALDSGTVYMFNKLARDYEAILEPFFK